VAPLILLVLVVVWPGGSPLILVVLGSVVDHGGSPDPSGLVVPLG
jgi:hypothetical protein